MKNKPNQKPFKFFLNLKQNPKDLNTFGNLMLSYNKIVPKGANAEICVFPQFPLIEFAIKKSKKNFVGAQNVSREEGGANTGEVSAKILSDLGCRYVIVGHSEIRFSFGETDEIVSEKVNLVLQNKMSPVICIGETQRSGSSYVKFLSNSLIKSVSGVAKNKAKDLVIAYEPVWAIGEHAKRPATPDEIYEVVMIFRKVLADLFGINIAMKIPIIYGGSTNEETNFEFISKTKVDGFLLGRMSLAPEKITRLITNISKNAIN